MAKNAARKGLSAKTFKGLSKKRMEKGAGNSLRLRLEKNKSHPVQFLETPDEMVEFDQHQFQDGNRWQYVPCTGEGCPLCDDDDRDVSRVRYRFITNVYSLKERKVLVMEGPKDLAQRVAFRYERKPGSFKKRVFDVTMFDSNPVSYQVELAEEEPVRVKSDQRHDLEKYITDALERYYGSGGSADKSALEEDDEDDDNETEWDEDEGYTKAELREMSRKELAAVAQEFGVKTKKNGEKRPTKAIIRDILAAQDEE